MKAAITVLPGDGIGPEVTAEAVRVLQKVAEDFGHRFSFTEAEIGGCAIDAHGNPLPNETVNACQLADAVLLGAIGGPKWDDPKAKVRPEQGLLGLRKAMGVYANLRPVKFMPEVADASPLKREVLEGVDLVVMRELTGGIYFGDKGRDEKSAYDVCTYTVEEIERITRQACLLAYNRRRKLTSVDKANVLETSRLWRETVDRVVQTEFPFLELEHMLVDAAAMHLMRRPADFDVMLTENMFGDILTDEASMLAGSMGLLASASLGRENAPGLYEPIHGSAPDIAGLGVANPLGAVLSAAMLLRHSLELETEAEAVETAVNMVLETGAVTPDIDPESKLGTVDVGRAVCEQLDHITHDMAFGALAMNIGALGT
ncbi:MAG: 3-isopropylmalate dehydrogenase [Acidobacteriota bacterium]|nr:3-isopropylmalate dehydrogenase [Acidobacteriota bacterium]